MHGRRLIAYLRWIWPCWVLGLGAACTPMVQQPLSPLVSPPQWHDTEFVMRDGTALPYVAWLPPDAAAPQAVMLGIHGFNDYRRAFELPGPYWAAQGMAVFAYDQRGFGAAPGRGVWPGQELLISDLEDVVAITRERYPQVPIYLIGDSMGGGIAMLAMQREGLRAVVSGVVLNAPAVWGAETFSPFYRWGLWLLAHTVPRWVVTSKGMKIQVSDNIDLLRALGRDPLMLRGARIDVLYGLVHLMDQALAAANSLPVPTLVLYGLRDEVIPKTAICSLLERMPENKRVFLFYPMGYHLLLRDHQAPAVWEDVRQWLLGRPVVSSDGGAACPAEQKPIN